MEIDGRNVEDAIQRGLERLKLKREGVRIEVLDEGKEGFLGFGSRPARVRLIPKEESFLYKAKGITEDILRLMGFDVNVEIEEGDRPSLNIKGEGVGLLIGRRGETLNALQFIINLILSRKGLQGRILLDSMGYRSRRRETLINIAIKAAEEAKSTKKKVVLEPMGPYERHLIHATLQDHEGVRTQSMGEGKRRRVVVVPRDDG